MCRVALLLALVLSSCKGPVDERPCDIDSDCLKDGVAGLCVQSPFSGSKWCAFPVDATECASGIRWGDLAGDGLAGMCMTDNLPADAAPPDGAMPDAIPTQELVVSLMGTGRGLVTSDPEGIACGTLCSAPFPQGSAVELSAVPLTGSRFDGWGGDDCTGIAPCTIDLTAPRTVDATFARVYSWIHNGGDVGQDEGRAVALRPSGDVVIVGSFSGTMTIGTETLTSDGPNPDIFIAQYSPSGFFRWAHRYGGSGTEAATAVAVDAAQNIHVVGTFDDSINFGGGDLLTNGGTDVFVAYLSGADGAYFDSTRIGGAGDEVGLGIGVDSTGDVVVVGAYGAPVDFGGGSRTAYGSKDIFVAKYSDQLNWLWDRTYGSGNIDEARAIAIDDSDGILVAGYYGGTVDFGAPTPTESAGATDIFVLRLESNGSFSWLNRYGGITFEAANAIAVDSSGAIIVGGQFSSSLSFGGVDQPLTPDGIADGFVLKLTSGGTYQWARAIGGPGSDFVRGVAATTDHIFAVGSFQEELDLCVGKHVVAGGDDGFVVKLRTASGEAAWTNALGGNEDDVVSGLAASAVGAVVITGSFEATVDLGGGPVQSEGMGDFFAIHFVP